MEEALILGNFAYSVPRDTINQFKIVPGVVDANFIFGPYDFYMLVKTETKKTLSDIVVQIRSNKAVTSTMTCYIVDLADIRPSGEKE